MTSGSSGVQSRVVTTSSKRPAGTSVDPPTAMPAGLHIVVLAHVYGLDIPFAAGLIVWTTMITVPILLVASVIV